MPPLADLITDRLQPALAALLTAFDYAADSGADRWEFAVEMTELIAIGAKLPDLRWLIRRGLAEHAKETTIPGDPARTFRPLAPTSFPPDACLTLTQLGANTLRPFIKQSSGETAGRRQEEAMLAPPLAAGEDANGEPQFVAKAPPSPLTGEGRGEGVAAQNGDSNVVPRSPDHATAQRVVNDAANGSPRPPSTSSGQADPRTPIPVPYNSPLTTHPSPKPKPRWYPDLHELHFNGTLVRRYKNPARNQELILAAFEEEGWPKRIDDPLPPIGDLDPRQRLRNTIVTLNRHQLAPLVHFRMDGTGCGVQWENRH
jgi:hypothetical protein